MIGNDIIDLKFAALESEPLRPGFQDKIFSKEEKLIIANSKDPILQIWILWSMKESTYKAHQRRFNLKRRINPHQLHCSIRFQDISSVSGEVNINSEKYFTKVELKTDYIHCTASGNEEQKIFNEILPVSADLKLRLLLKLSSMINRPSQDLKVIKNENSIPSISTGDRTLYMPFSLSHHGKFKAFSLPLMNY